MPKRPPRYARWSRGWGAAQTIATRRTRASRRGTMQVLDNGLLAFGDLEIRLKVRALHVKRALVAVSPEEFELITFFARITGRVVTRMQLLENVWSLHFDPGTNVVDVHVGRLRRKLEGAGPAAIQTARGEGYVFAPKAGAAG
ncbi:MAG: hypothetical protein C0524_00665 [Rhodobacter sp.]|nr:hypothetical protein [Rhodobacter sp.]